MREIRISADPASPSADWSRAHYDLLPDCQSTDFLIKKVFGRDKVVPFHGIPDIGQSMHDFFHYLSFFAINSLIGAF